MERLRFLSNCLGLRDFTLEAFYSRKHKLSIKKHPRILKIKVFGTVYSLTFMNPSMANTKSVLRSWDYSKVIYFFFY